jgi:putative ABC transport system permease protein
LFFRAKTVRRSFLTESSFVALEGVVLGAGLSLLTTYLLVRNSSAFEGLEARFVIDWPMIGLIVVGTFMASLIVTAIPARRAARILPALAVRVDG